MRIAFNTVTIAPADNPARRMGQLPAEFFEELLAANPEAAVVDRARIAFEIPGAEELSADEREELIERFWMHELAMRRAREAMARWQEGLRRYVEEHERAPEPAPPAP